MKYISGILGLLIVSILLTSCNDEIELTAERQDTTVIFGLLDISETTHFIKINRAFLGPGNSLEIAQIADSNYYENLEATITEVGGQERVWLLRDTLLNDKDTNGAFFAPQQKLYYFSHDLANMLDEDASYQLTVVINKGLTTEFTVSSETNLVYGLGSELSSYYKNFKFAANDGKFQSFSAKIDRGNSSVINLKLISGINEFIGADSDSIGIYWNIGDGTPETNSLNFSLLGERFYENIRDGVSDNPAIDKRNLLSITLEITGGTEELYNYMEVNKPSSSLAQNKPSYTNLVSSNGNPVIGIFSSRQTVRIYKPFINPASSNYRVIDPNSMQALCLSPITSSKLFCSHHPADNSFSYFCQ
jgi:hypothetical protein